MLLLVGLQLARLTVREEAPGAALATAIRLLAVPPIAWVMGRLVGEGYTYSRSALELSTRRVRQHLRRGGPPMVRPLMALVLRRLLALLLWRSGDAKDL